MKKALFAVLMVLVFLVFSGAAVAGDKTVTEELTLSWDYGPVDLPYISGFSVLWGSAAGGPYTTIDSTPATGGVPLGTDGTKTFSLKKTYTVTGPPVSSVTKYFVVIADSAGGPSGYSNEVSHVFRILPGAPQNLRK